MQGQGKEPTEKNRRETDKIVKGVHETMRSFSLSASSCYLFCGCGGTGVGKCEEVWLRNTTP